MKEHETQIFTASTVTEALAKIRSSLGDDAIILKTRQIERRNALGKKQRTVEVTASLGARVVHAGHSTPSGPSTPLRESLDPRPSMTLDQQLQRVMAKLDQMEAAVRDGQPHSMSPLAQQLRGMDFDESLIRRCVRWVEEDYVHHQGGLTPEVKGMLCRRLASSWKVNASIETTRCVALVGPTGVGKTTTAAKLGAMLRTSTPRPVNLASVDGIHVGKSRVLERYSELMGTGWFHASLGAELRHRVERQPSQGITIVDTPGCPHHEPARIEEIKGIIPSLAEVWLVLAANLRDRALRSVIDAFKRLDYVRVVFTKLDETPGPGAIASLADRCECPIAFTGIGEDILTGLVEADARRLACWSLGDPLSMPESPMVVQ